MSENGIPKIPRKLHRHNRKRLVECLLNDAPRSMVLLQGGVAINHYNTDTTYQFRQESFFMWLFGVREPGYYGALNVTTGLSILFMPRLPAEYATWMGPIPSPSEVKYRYGVDEVYYVDELDNKLFEQRPNSILLLTGANTDSGLTLPNPKFLNRHKMKVDRTLLYPKMSECRVIKTKEEIELIKHACLISCRAHKYVMSMIQHCCFEFQAESLFMHTCYYLGGARTTAYTNICGSGCNCAVLHYGDANAPNSKKLVDGDMCLFDMGASYSGYASDITISFPYSGKFRSSQKIIYNAVLSARNAVLKFIKPGVSWVDAHLLGHKVLIKKLVAAEILVGDVDAMIQDGISAVFQPHGLGHLIGVDVHDVGGYLEETPVRPTERWLKNLRTARILEEGIVITVEPGCYFIEAILDAALTDERQKKYFNKEQLKKFVKVGGVRIEDVVLITKDGCEVLSPLPRTVEEIEAWMKDSRKDIDGGYMFQM